MSNLTTVPLRSYDLAKYSTSVSCYVCEADNRFDEAFCSQCHAPLMLQGPDGKRTAPQLLTVLGGPGAGKTCYLGMLTDMLSRSASELELFARGAFSVALQQQTMSALACRRFPPATPPHPDGWQWVQGTVRSKKNKRPLEIILPDLSGAALLNEVDAPRSLPAMRRLLSCGAGAMLVVDADQLARGVQETEFAALKLIGDLLAVPPKQKKSWADRPIAIVLSKADRCDWIFDSVESFVRRHAPGLHHRCVEGLRRHRFFPVSIATATTAVDRFGERQSIPLRIEPRGVLEPFTWLVEQLSKSR